MAGEAPKAAFDMGRMAMGGFGQMLDGVEFMKRAWSSTLNLPGSFVPTVDIDELDKRIADLKAVEQWLNMNLSMLRGTVQALEVQRGTLAAIKAFGSTLGAARRAGGDDTEAAAALRRAMAEIAARTAAQPAPAPVARPTAASASAEPAASEPAASGRRAGASRARATPAGTPGAAPGDRSPAAPPPVLPAINPGAWWNLLQQNFNQVAEAALSGVGLQAAVPSASTAAVAKRPAPKTAAGTASERGRAGAPPRPRSRKRAGSRPPGGGA
jgi:hypothetical protein